MKSLIVPLLKSKGKSIQIYDELIENLYTRDYKPHEFVIAMMDEYHNYDSTLPKKLDRSIHGRFFELVIGETLVQQGVKNLYFQAEVRHVPLAKFDWFMYHEILPVSVSCKTSTRERVKQALYEAMALKQVYIQSTNYLITIEPVGSVEELKINSPAIDQYLIATSPEFSQAVKDISGREFFEATKQSPILSGNFINP